jgi:uncharacterized protein (TIGR04255 family)
MARDETVLPDFAHPPVVEVVLGMQFEPLADLKMRHFGLLWRELFSRYPQTEDLPPLQQAVERFGAGPQVSDGPKIELSESMPLPRCWYINDPGTQLVQVQRDRFVCNWKKQAREDEYPRYENIRDTFRREAEVFATFVERQSLGEINPNQCEVTYVNLIEPGPNWSDPGELGQVLTVFDPRYSEPFLPEIEHAEIGLRYVIPGPGPEDPVGRLRVNIRPVFRSHDGVPLFRLQMMARGQPLGEGLDGVVSFFNLGREWIVRGFAAITETEMHRVWGRHDGGS